MFEPKEPQRVILHTTPADREEREKRDRKRNLVILTAATLQTFVHPGNFDLCARLDSYDEAVKDAQYLLDRIENPEPEAQEPQP